MTNFLVAVLGDQYVVVRERWWFLDVNAEIELWTRAGHVKVNVGKGIDIRRLDSIIANAVLGSLS